MHLELHDKEGRIELEDLTFEGAHEAQHQCTLLSDELQELMDQFAEEEERLLEALSSKGGK